MWQRAGRVNIDVSSVLRRMIGTSTFTVRRITSTWSQQRYGKTEQRSKNRTTINDMVTVLDGKEKLFLFLSRPLSLSRPISPFPSFLLWSLHSNNPLSPAIPALDGPPEFITHLRTDNNHAREASAGLCSRRCCGRRAASRTASGAKAARTSAAVWRAPLGWCWLGRVFNQLVGQHWVERALPSPGRRFDGQREHGTLHLAQGPAG